MCTVFVDNLVSTNSNAFRVACKCTAMFMFCNALSFFICWTAHTTLCFAIFSNEGFWTHPQFHIGSGTSDFIKIQSQREKKHRSSSACEEDYSCATSDSPPNLSADEYVEEITHHPPLQFCGESFLCGSPTLNTCFCQSCSFFGGSICCNACPQDSHKDCITSRCVAGHRAEVDAPL
jgi:hypothetical protein